MKITKEFKRPKENNLLPRHLQALGTLFLYNKLPNCWYISLVSSNNKWWLNSQMSLDIHIQLQSLEEHSFTRQHPTHRDFTIRADTNWNWSIILTSFLFRIIILFCSAWDLFSKNKLSIEKKRWQHNPLVSHPLPTFSCHPRISWKCTPSLMKILNKPRSSCTLFFSGLQPDVEPMTPWVQPFSQFSISLTACSSNPYFSSFSKRILWQIVTKALLKSRKTIFTARHSSIRLAISLQMITGLVRHDFLRTNPCRLFLMVFFSLRCLDIVSRISCSIILPETEMRLTGLQFFWSSFFHFLRTGATFAFLQSVGTSLSTVSAHGCIPPESMDWECPPCTTIPWLGPLPPKGMSSLFQTFSLASGTWEGQFSW